MKNQFSGRLACMTLSCLVGLTGTGLAVAETGSASEPSYSLPGSRASIGMNGKDSGVYAELGKLAATVLRDNQTPFVDPTASASNGSTVIGGLAVSADSIREDFATFCLDADFSDKVAWRRETSGEIWLQFSCVKDGEYPALRERLFVLKVAPQTPSRWGLIDFQLLSANIEPGSKLEFKPAASSGIKSPIARASIAITGAVLLSAAAAKRSYPDQDDKVHHAVASGVLAAGAASYLHLVHDMSPEKSALAGGALSLLLGGSKEALDPYAGGVRSKHDMKANLIGAALGTVTMYLSFKFN